MMMCLHHAWWHVLTFVQNVQKMTMMMMNNQSLPRLMNDPQTAETYLN